MIEIKYKSNAIKKKYTDEKFLERKFNKAVALKYRQFVETCVAFNDIDSMKRTLPAYHIKKLSGKLKGQWSARLNDTYRVNFTVDINGHILDVQIITINKIHPHDY